MANACLFIGWNRAHPGREKEAWSFLTGPAMEMLEQWKKDGWYESSRAYGLTAHGGDLNGVVIIEGSRDKLDELRRTDAFEKFSMTMATHFDRYGAIPGVTQDGMDAVKKRNPELMG
jgi:hypothetical protein